jgi:hypothetical protein
VSVWLLTATVVHCSTVYDIALGSKFICKQDALGAYLIVYRKWPYDHTPFLGYWNFYDNKFAMLLDEPYSYLSLMLAMSYLVWFRIVILRNHNAGKKTQIAFGSDTRL